MVLSWFFHSLKKNLLYPNFFYIYRWFIKKYKNLYYICYIVCEIVKDKYGLLQYKSVKYLSYIFNQNQNFIKIIVCNLYALLLGKKYKKIKIKTSVKMDILIY